MLFQFFKKYTIYSVALVLSFNLFGQEIGYETTSSMLKRGEREGTQSGGGGGKRLGPARKQGVLIIDFLKNNEKGQRLVETYDIDINHLEAANHNDNYAPVPYQIADGKKVFDMWVNAEKTNTFYINNTPYNVFEIQIFSPPTPGLFEYSPKFIAKELFRSIDRNDLVLGENIHIKIEILMEEVFARLIISKIDKIVTGPKQQDSESDSKINIPSRTEMQKLYKIVSQADELYQKYCRVLSREEVFKLRNAPPNIFELSNEDRDRYERGEWINVNQENIVVSRMVDAWQLYNSAYRDAKGYARFYEGLSDRDRQTLLSAAKVFDERRKKCMSVAKDIMQI